MPLKHFRTLLDLSPEHAHQIVKRALELKEMRANGIRPRIFEQRVLAMIFDKSSTRTRVSFESAMIEGGGGAIFLSPRDSQLGRGEPIADTGRVLSEMCDALFVRTFDHADVESLAANSKVPVINGLSDEFHPCQLLADMQTYAEFRGEIRDKRVAWVGDGNNMCNSYINAADRFGFILNIASPPGYEANLLEAVPPNARVEVFDSPVAAVSGVDLVVTDVWASMGQESDAEARLAAFRGYQVNEALMSKAAPDALFMHCLPAHRGEEVSAGVIDHEHSVVWAEAGNRLHSQKALLEFLWK
ncbi:MAG: ornithine carbamoyltransferase [Gammaproteobacteria bacterium]